MPCLLFWWISLAEESFPFFKGIVLAHSWDHLQPLYWLALKQHYRLMARGHNGLLSPSRIPAPSFPCLSCFMLPKAALTNLPSHLLPVSHILQHLLIKSFDLTGFHTSSILGMVHSFWRDFWLFSPLIKSQARVDTSCPFMSFFLVTSALSICIVYLDCKGILGNGCILYLPLKCLTYCWKYNNNNMLTETGWNNLNRDVFYHKSNFMKIEMFPRKVLIFMTFFKEEKRVYIF